jgi:anti-sigma factor RsiW
MMDCALFRSVLHAWMDGELRREEEASASEHLSSCEDCLARAEAEKALEGRVRTAMEERVDPARVREMLRWARTDASNGLPPVSGPPVHPVGVLLLPRLWGSMAASVAALLGVAWLFCVPPFECPYLQAVEEAATAAAPAAVPGAPAPDAVARRIRPPETLAGRPRKGEAERVPVVLLGNPIESVRARYDFQEAEVLVVWSDAMGGTPSFRRRATRDDQEWWIAHEGGRTLVAYMSRTDRVLCTVVGPLPEARLLEAASALRAKSP